MPVSPRLLTAVLTAAVTLSNLPAIASPQLIAIGKIPGSAVDNSGFTGTMTAADGTGTAPQNLLGSFGSSITYFGENRYIAVNDRGFGNGTTHYLDRFQTFDLDIDITAKTITPKLIATTFLTKDGKNFTGDWGDFSHDTGAGSLNTSLRFDPEGARVTTDGSLYISDEYGPYIYRFNLTGKFLNSYHVPAKFGVTVMGDENTEIQSPANNMGRVANKGMEGLALTPDGKTLVSIMQSPLIQDHAITADFKKAGINNRILTVDIATGKTHEYVYQMDDKKYGVSEVLAVDNHRFLVDERDGKSGLESSCKKIYLIDIDGATDVSDIGTTPGNGLPTATLPDSIQPVIKTLFLDLLDPQYGLSTADFPEKIEGLTFGPDLADGRRQLIITSDNDLIAANPTWILDFAVEAP